MLCLQRHELQEVDKALRGEYSMRRRMLIERAKVTLQSFMWAEKLQGSADKEHAQAAADKGEALMHSEPAVSLEDVFAAKQGVSDLPGLPNLNKTCCHDEKAHRRGKSSCTASLLLAWRTLLLPNKVCLAVIAFAAAAFAAKAGVLSCAMCIAARRGQVVMHSKSAVSLEDVFAAKQGAFDLAKLADLQLVSLVMIRRMCCLSKRRLQPSKGRQPSTASLLSAWKCVCCLTRCVWTCRLWLCW